MHRVTSTGALNRKSRSVSTERRQILRYKSIKGELILTVLAWACLLMGVACIAAPRFAGVLLYTSPFPDEWTPHAKQSYTFTPTIATHLRSLGAYLCVLGAFALNAQPTEWTLKLVGLALIFNGSLQGFTALGGEYLVTWCVGSQIAFAPLGLYLLLLPYRAAWAKRAAAKQQ